ncbi:MAG: hypothetical protein FGM57_00415 [Candidatus Taylorbacteria bacterium]|nr:hypothetical protein [Candidatus Taylorbacteria bacterium]
MTSEAKIITGIGIFTILIIILGLMFSGAPNPNAEVSINKEILVNQNNPIVAGTAEKRVQIVEFGDFQCPACAMLSFNMKELFKTHGDKIDFVFRVIPIHQYSVEAAGASYAAHEQGKFKEMYEKLFEKQDEWSTPSANRPELFATYATEIGLNVEQFKKDISSKAGLYKTYVDADAKDAAAMNVAVTPTLIINGNKVVRGAVGYEQLKSLVESELNPATSTNN